VEPVLSPPAPRTLPPIVREAPPPLRGGPLALLRWLRAHGMLDHRYARLGLRWLWLKARWRGRLVTDGLCFVAPGVQFEIGPDARVVLGRWSWIGHGTKIRAHEGEVVIGAKSVLGQECTISCYQHVSIGRECIVADRAMLIDFDHGVVETDRPIRAQGIYKRDVRIGHNVWVGYGASFLRGVTVGDNCVVGTYAVVTKDVPPNAVVAGVPARVLRMRPAPERLRWG
jgi:acetyltransferase-like isoleucine patch superfamily enzyme